MSFSETVFLFVLALIIFGPKKLPEIARQVAKYMNEFRRASNEFKAQLEQEVARLDVEEKKKTVLPASPAPDGTASRTLTATAPEVKPAEEPAEFPTSGAKNAPEMGHPETEAASADEPLFASKAEAAPVDVQAAPSPNPAPSADAADPAASTTQESHV